jgi:hypothetical protein
MLDSTLCFTFPFGRREVSCSFDGGSLSSDGGLVLLRQLDLNLGLVKRLSSCLTDGRQARKVRQSVEEMLRQRILGLCLGYEDCNDFDTLCGDPLFKLAMGRLPHSGSRLASQPTLCRFENGIGRKELVRMSEALVDHFTASRPGGVGRIVLDIDATDDPAHGQQELEFYHGYYGRHCFLPLLVFATVDDEPDQHLLAAVLRPGNRHAGHGSVGVLKRIVARLRQSYPGAQIVVRGDAGFALPAMYEWCEKEGLQYCLSLPRNSRLIEMGDEQFREARRRCSETGATSRVFGEFSYAAQTWSRERRVIIKAEVMPTHGDNPRFVVTNIAADQASPEGLYDFYTERGDAENRIKELKNDLSSGRTSCHRFAANQFRLLMHAAAMVLMQALRGLMSGTDFANMQAGTLRVKLLKVATRVTETCRKIRLKLPTSYPWQDAWRKAWERMVT